MLVNPDQRGQGLVEYALILVLVAVVVVLILAVLGPSIGNLFSNIVHNI
jgi:pilus assembly protein Flp/PilA